MDLLIGCGGLYALGLGAYLLLRGRSSDQLEYMLPLAVLLVTVPHYGATLQRVYGSAEQRSRYAFFTVYATAALVAWFVVGTFDPLLGSLMITVFLSWSPWHYSGQNYGIAMMYLGRAGIVLPPAVKRTFWTTFVLSYLLSQLNLHGSRSAAHYATGAGEQSLGVLPLGLPQDVVAPLFAGIVVLYLGVLVIAGIGLLRAGAAKTLLPVAAIVFTQALWFVVPFFVIQWLALELGDPRYGVVENAILWLAIAHGAQYLWVTSYYARASSSERGYRGYLVKTMLFGAAAWSLPVVAFAPEMLAGASYTNGHALLIAALVNIHHFVLDGAIWKLRSGRVASVLIRGEKTQDVRGLSLRTTRLAVAVGVACTVVYSGYSLATEIVLPIAIERGQVRTASAILDGLGWVTIDAEQKHAKLGDWLLAEGDEAGAIEHYRRAVEIAPDLAVKAHFELGRLLFKDGQVDEAIEHLKQAVALRPGYRPAQVHLQAALSHARALKRNRERARRTSP